MKYVYAFAYFFYINDNIFNETKMNEQQLHAYQTGNYKAFLRAGGNLSQLENIPQIKNNSNDDNLRIYFIIFAMVVIVVIVICYLVSTTHKCQHEKFSNDDNELI